MIVIAGLGVFYVGALIAALIAPSIAKFSVVIWVILGAVVAFMASRDGHNALFGAIFLVFSSVTVAAGVDTGRLAGLSWMDNDFSFWILAAIDGPPLFTIGLAIGLIAVFTRPNEGRPALPGTGEPAVMPHKSGLPK